MHSENPPTPESDGDGSENGIHFEYGPHVPPTTSEAAASLEPPASAIPPVERPPRVWPALLVGIGAIPCALVVTTLVMVVAAQIDVGPSVLGNPDVMMRWLEHFSESQVGLLVLLLPGQGVFLLMAVLPALVSRQPFAERLGLQRGPLPLWTWAVFALATPMIGLLASQLIYWLFGDLGEHLEMMERILRGHAQGFLLGLVLLVAVLPGLVEELMFRGYLQSRLLKRLPPLAAIMISATIFALAHLDKVHAVGVLPLGIWLGLVAWRADSILPAMGCHAVNNAVAIVGFCFQEPETLGMTADTFTIICLAVSFPAFLLSLVVLRN